MSYTGNAPIGLRDCGLGGCSVVCATRPSVTTRKSLIRGGRGTAAAALAAMQSSWGWGAASQPHAEQRWCPCAAPGENSNFRGGCLTYFRAACQGPGRDSPRWSCLQVPPCHLGLCALLRGCVPRCGGSIHCSGGSMHCSGAVYTAPGLLCIALGLCTLLQGLCTLLQGLCALLWGSVHCSGGLCLFLWGCVVCSRGSAHRCHLAASLKKCSCCRSCCPLPSSRTLPAAGRLHHCHVAASVSISATAAHCLCLRTRQGPAGPAPMAFCSCGAWPAPRGPSSPGCGTCEAGAAHPHQQPGPGSVPACHRDVGSLRPGRHSAAAGNLLLYIDPFGVVFSIFIDKRGVWFCCFV